LFQGKDFLWRVFAFAHCRALPGMARFAVEPSRSKYKYLQSGSPLGSLQYDPGFVQDKYKTTAFIR
ncbi:MAG: hypothetical protein AAB356_06180, partial [Deltaproteobacteria bacterium]